jgi:hypothetical protein
LLRATLVPSDPLYPSTGYTATITTGATDLANPPNSLQNNFSWSFTTEPASICPCTVWDDTDVPVHPSEADPNPVVLGVKLRSDVDGFITGIRFYKGDGNTGTHVGNLWTSDGTLLASKPFTNETGTGWQQVDFDYPVAISADTDYVASYYAPNGNYASDEQYFTYNGVDNGYLHLLANGGASGGNGVYAYGGSSGFPTFTWHATNYWVDVVFDTSDATVPAVVSTTPTAGASGVSPAVAVAATFSKPMNADSIDATSFELRDAGNALVPATVTYDALTRTAKLTPADTLSLQSSYNATLTTAITDAAGNALETDFTWSFTTADTIAPPGLVAAFNFDEGSGSAVADSSGNGNSGAVAGASWTAEGKVGSALVFDGVDNRVDVPDSDSLDLANGMTLEAWVYPTALSGWRTVIMKEASNGLAYVLYANDNAPRSAGYVHIGGDMGVPGSSALPLNIWTHLAVTYDGAVLRLYENGVEVGSQAVSGDIATSSQALRIGGNAVWGEYFSGRIDQVRIYNRALTPAEIQNDM